MGRGDKYVTVSHSKHKGKFSKEGGDKYVTLSHFRGGTAGVVIRSMESGWRRWSAEAWRFYSCQLAMDIYCDNKNVYIMSCYIYCITKCIIMTSGLTFYDTFCYTQRESTSVLRH